jgi:hypothetical protein
MHTHPSLFPASEVVVHTSLPVLGGHAFEHASLSATPAAHAGGVVLST